LLITADAGGSNGPRVRAFKYHLAKLSAETGLSITVCHYPPGTSKWNKIEHRLFSFISINWRGRSLTDIRTIVELIAATKTKTGLTVQCDYDPNWYPTGVKISDRDYAAIPLRPHDWHGEWNYRTQRLTKGRQAAYASTRTIASERRSVAPSPWRATTRPRPRS
jgi:hypothetical protein